MSLTLNHNRMNEIEKNDQALIEEFNSLFLDTMYKDDGYSEEREVLSNWLRTLIAQKNKEREEAAWSAAYKKHAKKLLSLLVKE